MKFYKIELTKHLPDDKEKLIWQQSVQQFREKEPKLIYYYCLLAGCFTGLGVIIGASIYEIFLSSSNELSRFFIPMICAGVGAEIGSRVIYKILTPQIIPYIQEKLNETPSLKEYS